MNHSHHRRSFLKTMATLPVLAATPDILVAAAAEPGKGHKLRISLNAYSFNAPLRDGSMGLDGLLEFCAGTPIEAVDLTGYYFPGYPAVPPDAYIYHIKRKAFRLGLDISGTGVRTDFTNPDTAKRKADVQLVKNWIVVAAKLGAPVIRIFAGAPAPAGKSWNDVAARMMEHVQECVAFGKEQGVIVGMQHHNDFIKTAEHVHAVSRMITSDWFGIIVDTGSYQSGDPYAQIAETAKYAVNWQLKENVFINGKAEPADVPRIISAIRASGYKGYVPVETLGPGDPRVKVPVFVEKVRKALFGEAG
ncbi:sugar phosphate isomerase/epimerase [Chitinophaga lutea]|uniref:Sugar phosphate isomerase/epimerase n=1 Tax=Chitinophaga lutea TaxID=2488634 RepID=A0A3N4PGY3_9BACT|nr:sugar phosphate isomerase/epimerase family protein [Chitinophaga lutea]RPE07953.1 sugar phosphate isomerase/epimerase [Chitinophaga lutea]